MSGTVYLDAQVVIYSVEDHPRYAQVLRPLWQSAKAGSAKLVTSELTLLETLVGPLKSGKTALADAYERLLFSSDIQSIPITTGILKMAAHLRATSNLKAPDAIHLSTALSMVCDHFVTNDVAFKTMPHIPIVMLDGLLSSP